MEYVKEIFQYGGTVIMAGLFVWVYIQDKTKYNNLLVDNSKMLENLSKSNENIAKSLEIISKNQISLETKVDRNYEEIRRIEEWLK